MVRPAAGNLTGENKMSIWTILFVVLLIAWIGGFTMFHVAGGLIHLLLVFAVISLILHFVMGRRTV
jgi:DNA-binding transcriptional regulator of glucitol operon